MPPTDANSPDQFKAPTNDDALIVWANKKRDAAFKLPEHQAKQNLAFVQGQQWGVWDGRRKRFHQADTRRGDPNAPVRITVNKIGGIVERVISRILKNIPIAECRPVTDTVSDVNAAKVGTRILDHELNARLKLQQRLIEVYTWALPLGWSFLHVRWDPTAGPIVGTVDEEGNEVQVHQGEVVLDECPAFELRLDPNARRFRDAMWCVRDVVMTKEAAYEQYGVMPEAEDATSLADEWRQLSGPGDEHTGTGGKPADAASFVTVHQLWVRPGSRANPDGLVFTWCGKTVMEKAKPFPYEHGKLPFVPFNILPALGGAPNGRTWVTDLVPLQRDYNDARSREAMIRRTLTPKILAATGQIDPNRLTSRVELVTYNPTGPQPQFMLPDGRWMSQFQAGMERADTEMGERAGQTDVSSGRAATSAPAASILALQEADETKLAITTHELAASVEELAHQVLMLCKQFWDEERTVRTWSRDGVLEVSHFRGSDLGQQLDVHVSSEAGLPRSKTARTQLAIDLWSQGILTDARDFVRLLDLPGSDFLVETLNLDNKQAEREIGHILAGEVVEAKTWHNHQAHITTHDEFRKSEEYEHLDPQQQAALDGHIMAHYQQMLDQMMNDPMAAGAAPPGAGPETTNPTGANGEPIDPTTGLPQDPNAMAGGLAPTALQGAMNMPVGGTGQPGPVPGTTPDGLQAAIGN